MFSTLNYIASYSYLQVKSQWQHNFANRNDTAQISVYMYTKFHPFKLFDLCEA